MPEKGFIYKLVYSEKKLYKENLPAYYGEAVLAWEMANEFVLRTELRKTVKPSSGTISIVDKEKGHYLVAFETIQKGKEIKLAVYIHGQSIELKD